VVVASAPVSFNGAAYRDLVLTNEWRPKFPYVMRITFTRDGRKLAAKAGSNYGVWDAATRLLVGRFGHPGGSDEMQACLGLTPNGLEVVTLNPGSPFVRFWDGGTVTPEVQLRNDQPIRQWRVPVPGRVATKLARDGRRVFLGITPNDLGKRVYDMTTGEFITLDPPELCSFEAFSPNMTRIAGRLSSGAARLWDASTGKTIWTTNLDPDPDGSAYTCPADVVFSPDGRFIAIPAGGGAGPAFKPLPHSNVFVITTADGAVQHRIPVVSEGIALGGRRPTLVVRTPDHGLRVIDLPTGQEVAGFMPPGGMCLGLAVSPDG
jgi:WD40 repeat protein